MTIITETTTTTAIDIKPDDLVAAIKAVTPHVSKDLRFTALASIQFRLHDGELTLTATDRYTLAQSKVGRSTDHQDGEDFSVLVSLADAKRIATYLKSVKMPAVPLKVDAAAGSILVGFDGESVAARTVDGEFPKLDHIVPSGDKLGEVSELGFNGDYLARFATKNLARGGEKNLPTRLSFVKSGGPVKVTFSDHFVGVCMTVRLAD